MLFILINADRKVWGPNLMSNDAVTKLRGFEYKDESKVVKKKVRRVSKKITKNSYVGLEDLNPSIKQNLLVLFVGFNPGVESSKTQHHYAHYTNLFWKLFNDSKLLIKVLEALDIDIPSTRKSDGLLREIMVDDNTSNAQAVHDNDLIKFDIGFTDLVLRCTKSAQELTLQEKLDNVPRLLSEFKVTKSKKIVIIGKGIWEIIIKYIQKKGVKDKNFEWGKQDSVYTEWLKQEIPHEFDLFVFPNTSGLVASMKYHQKLQLWNSL